MSENESLADVVSLMIKVACPLLLILGTFGNIMTVVVFLRLNDYSSVSTFYIALALCDLVLLYSGWLNHVWLNFQFQVNIVDVHSISCKMGVYLPVMSSALSSWYLVAMTIQRAMSIVWPHRINVVCTRNVSRVVTAVIGLVIMASYSHILYGIYLPTDINTNLSCPICKCGFVNADYRYFYDNIWPLLELIISSIGPFALLLVSNNVLVKAVLTSVNNIRQGLAVGQSIHVNSRERQAFSLSVTLIALSVTFFVLSGPLRMLMIAYQYTELEVRFKSSNMNLIMFALYIPFSANNALNFYLYCLTGTEFRKKVANVLFKWKSVKKTSGKRLI